MVAVCYAFISTMNRAETRPVSGRNADGDAAI